jgi:hypothetical protein
MAVNNDRQKIRTYLDDVPEDVKEQLSKAWRERKTETYAAAKKHGIKIEQGDSFNKVVTFELFPGYYHLTSGIVSVKDISPAYSDIGALTSGLVDRMIEEERERLQSFVCFERLRLGFQVREGSRCKHSPKGFCNKIMQRKQCHSYGRGNCKPRRSG